MPENQLTIVLVAHNAAATIGRAVASARAAGDYPLLLVDDHSTDDTASIAVAAGGGAVTVIRPDRHINVGHARQTALEALATPYAIWLDADDELMPGRPRHMLAALVAGADLVFDPVMLVDSEQKIPDLLLPIPEFFTRPGGLWRAFERNWIPMLAGGFKVAAARAIGFDAAFANAEDYDFFLRSLMAGHRMAFLPEPGYRYYHYPQSLSRNLRQAQAGVQAAQAKHDWGAVAARLRESNLPLAEQTYVLAARAQVMNDLARLERHVRQIPDDDTPLAPYGRPARACGLFLLAAAWAGTGRADEARFILKDLMPFGGRDIANNLAAAHWLMGAEDEAAAIWRRLVVAHPDYLDASHNLKAVGEGVPKGWLPHITRQPLRPIPARAAY